MRKANAARLAPRRIESFLPAIGGIRFYASRAIAFAMNVCATRQRFYVLTRLVWPMVTLQINNTKGLLWRIVPKMP
jgi:hypothetical protein